MNICEINDCTGCGTCTQVCPASCIEMIYNDEGFLYPKVSDKCILCGACREVCPINNPVELNDIKDVYTGYTKDEKILLSSTSGGIFTELSRYVISRGGYIFGVEFTENFLSVKHTFTNNLDYIANYRGSKYIQSETNNAFEKAKNLLDKGFMVLFSGTPCQVAGLRNFLAKEYENLFTMDFICHGVGSKLIWLDFLKMVSRSNKIDNVSFRSKLDGYNNGFGSTIVIYKNNSILYKSPYFKSIFGFGYSRCLINRISCYKCPYVNKKRCSDITVSDYVGKDNNELENTKGCSGIFLNSKKGVILFNSIKDNLIYKRRNINDLSFLKNLPPRIRLIPEFDFNNRKEVFSYYKLFGFKKTSKKYLQDNLSLYLVLKKLYGKFKLYLKFIRELI